MKRMYRIWCVLLTVCLLLSMVPAGATATETDTKECTDFVLVLDCSGSLLGNDRELAISACKMFVDLIPVENARVSVITIGRAGGAGTVYTFSKEFLTTMEEYHKSGLLDRPFGSSLTRDNLNSLFSVVDLSSAETLAVKQLYKDKITEASRQMGQQTPIAHALAASLDMLEHNGAQPGNACVVLLTDGELTSGDSVESKALKKWVISTASEKEWPIYCIDTNFGKDKDKGLLDEISKGTGYANGKMKSESAVEICGHFLEIFNHFMENKNGVQEKVGLKSGVAEHTFTVPMLSSETNIVVAGSDPKKGLDIHKVEIYRVGSDEPIISVTENDLNKGITNPFTVMATVEQGVYYCVKMITPPAGDYVLRAYGKDNTDTSILVYDSSLQEMDLAMNTDPIGGATPVAVDRDQVISINAAFSYAGYKVSSTDEVERGYYEKQNAVLKAYDEQNNVLFSDTMAIGENGYHYDLALNATNIQGGQKFRIAVEIEKNDMYRTGKKESNSVWFEAKNRPLEKTGADPITLTGHVNQEMDTDILLGNLYSEADGDTVNFELVDFKQILANGAVSIEAFKYDLRDNTDAVWIQASLKPGQYEATLVLSETGSSETIQYLVKMDVENDPMTCATIDPIEIWTDRFPLFQSDEFMEWSGDMNAYFSDDEKVAIEYAVSETASSGLLDMTFADGSKVHLQAAGAETGKTSLTIVAKQYAGEEMTDRLEITVPVVVKSGRAEFWKDNWIWFALGAGLIVLIVAIILFLSGSTRVKGTWQITYEENGSYAEAGSVRISSSLPCGRKKKFLFHEMITQLNRYADEQDRVIARVPNYLADEAIRRIQIHGITFGSKGFLVKNIPNDENKILVEYMGRRYNNKVKVTGGRVTFTIKMTDSYNVPTVLVITMDSMGK